MLGWGGKGRIEGVREGEVGGHFSLTRRGEARPGEAYILPQNGMSSVAT